jgi:hypothetical protein
MIDQDFGFTDDDLRNATAAVPQAPVMVDLDDETCDEPDVPGPNIAVILMGVVVPLLSVGAFGWYLYSKDEPGRYEARIREIYTEADTFEKTGMPEEAYRKFMAIVSAAAKREVVDPVTRGLVVMARDRATRLFPKAEEAHLRRKAAKGAVDSGWDAFYSGLTKICIALVAIAILLLPLILPLLLSRRGVLSVPRWLIMAAFFFFLGLVLVAFWYVFERDVFPQRFNQSFISGLGFFSVWMMLGVPGCLLASAVYPKDHG